MRYKESANSRDMQAGLDNLDRLFQWYLRGAGVGFFVIGIFHLVEYPEVSCLFWVGSLITFYMDREFLSSKDSFK